MTVEEKITRAFDLGKTLVFPTQAVADSQLRAYAEKRPDRAVFSDRALSWDRFREGCSAVPENSRAAMYPDRRVFISLFFDRPENTAGLKYFFNPQYPESAAQFASDAAENLSGLERALEHEDLLSPDLLNDSRLLYSAYTGWLAERDLYEREFVKPDFSKAAKEGKTVLVFPSSYRDTAAAEAVKSGLETIETPVEGCSAVLTVYSNTLCEIRAAARRIRELLKSGVPARSIAVTLTRPDSCFPFLEAEFSRRNIRLVRAEGKKLTAYGSGRFFEDIQRIYSENYSFDSVKSLLLNPVYPFRNRELLLETVRLGVELKIQDGGRNASVWKDRLSRGGESSAECCALMQRLGQFISGANGIIHAKDADALRKAVQGFQDTFFEKGSWAFTGRETDINVFRRCMETLDALDAACAVQKLPAHESFYGIFLDVLRHTQYTPDTKAGGVRVYTYPVTAGLSVPYHFVLGLDDDSTRIERRIIPFSGVGDTGPDTEQSVSEQIGDSVIEALCWKMEGLELSCASETYAGAVTEPAFFTERGCAVKAEAMPEDEFAVEERLWRMPETVQGMWQASDKTTSEAGCTELQALWFSGAVNGTLDIQRREEYPRAVLPLRISATAMNEFESCPYRWLCRYVRRLPETDFEPLQTDHAAVGNIIHNAYEEFFTQVGSWDSFEEKIREGLLESIFLNHLERYAEGPDAPDSLHIKRLGLGYAQLLGGITRAAKNSFLEGAETADTERHFEFSTEDFREEGFIDCVMELPGGGYAVIDFKKGSAPEDSVQLLMYAEALALGEDGGTAPSFESVCANAPLYGAFYSVSKRQFVHGWNGPEEFAEKLREFIEKREDMVNRVKSGDFEPTPSDKNCQFCPYSGLCRKRFVIK